MKIHLPVITSYDIVKTVAVVSMVLDHVGYYFYPDNLWWRALTFSAPIWFFLIGFAKSRDLSAPLWIGCAVLVLASAAAGEAVLPLNILATMILYRLVIDPLMAMVRRNPQSLYPLALLAAVLTFATYMLVDYGTSGLLYVMLGYLVRRRGDFPAIRLPVFALGVWAAFSFLQILFFFGGFTAGQGAVVAVSYLLLTFWLISFRLESYPRLTSALPVPARGLLHLCGRYSLWIYVVHLVIFKGLALWLGLSGYALFDFHIMDA